jgi:ketosteroid isomerase-like protein
MKTLPTDTLPQAILDHIAAYNAHDLEALMASLAPDALINDISREFLGEPAIRDFAQKELIGPKVTLAPVAAFEQAGQFIVRFHVDGEYDKSKLPDPLILTFYFTMQDGRIGQLIILHNKLVAA